LAWRNRGETSERWSLRKELSGTKPTLGSGTISLMAIDPDALLRDALTLPADLRAELAADLLASIDRDEHDDPDEVRAALAAELERRARSALSGEDPGRPWPEVRERIRSDLAQ
jgi:putative addiction module component (TIGR02574 family)